MDADKDIVTVESDNDVMEAVTVQAVNPLYLTVVDVESYHNNMRDIKMKPEVDGRQNIDILMRELESIWAKVTHNIQPEQLQEIKKSFIPVLTFMSIQVAEFNGLVLRFRKFLDSSSSSVESLVGASSIEGEIAEVEKRSDIIEAEQKIKIPDKDRRDNVGSSVGGYLIEAENYISGIREAVEKIIIVEENEERNQELEKRTRGLLKENTFKQQLEK